MGQIIKAKCGITEKDYVEFTSVVVGVGTYMITDAPVPSSTQGYIYTLKTPSGDQVVSV
jgi:hypothetical protein